MSVSSFGSSFASGQRSSAQFIPKGEPNAETDEGFEEHSSLQQGVFGHEFSCAAVRPRVLQGHAPWLWLDDADCGASQECSSMNLTVLYTVSKEHKATLRFAVSRLVLDFWQLWLLVVNPAYGFDINVNSKIWKAASFIQLDWILLDRGYTFFLIVLYMLLALLALNVLLSMWVAYQFSNNRFDQVWPIAFLRWFGLIFFQVLDIATLTLLLGTLDCHYMGGPPQLRYYNALFPEVYCWSMPHLVHVAVSVVGLLVFEVMASAMVLSQMDLNPLSRQPLAIMHSSTEGLCFGLKSIAAIAAVMLAGDVRWLAVLYMTVFVALLYLQLKWVPATYAVVNYARCATYGCVLYCSALLCVLAFMTPSARQPERRKEFQHQVTLALWIGMGPAALAGMAACWARLHYFCVVVAERFRTATPGLPSKYICKFEDAREVGVALRACRDWIPGDEDTLKPEAMALGEVIVKAGIMQLPSNPRMTLLYSSFLIDVQGSYQSGYTQLQAAKQQSPGLLDRFAIFSREQEHTQKASGVNGAGDGVVDLVSYVEFQRSHRLVTRAHKEALLAMRAFWSLLLHSRVSFMRLTHAINRIEVSIRSAERAYQSVLTRHGHNARLVRLYGRFLESVKFDPWAAAKWFTEADRLEEREEHAKEAMQLGGALVALGATAGGGGAMAVDGLAALFINSQGIIQVATPEVHALLGYAKGELKDRDVACIMPPPFGDRHNAYLRNYIQTGVSHVLDRTTDFVALTKTRSVAPIRLRISKVSGLSEDSVFMGVMEPLPPQPGVVRAWVMGNGGGTAGATGNTLIAAEEGFYDWLGYGPGELLGQPLSALVNDAPTVDVVIKDLQQSLLTPPIATKATATAAAAVAAGRSRCRSGDLTGPGVPPSQPLSAAQQGQLGSSTGPGSPGVAEGGDRGIGHGGMGRSTGSQLLGFSLAALMLARDTAGGGGKADAALDASDTSAHGNGASGEVGGIVRGVGSRTANQPQPTATLPGLEWRHKYSGSIPLTTILSADAFGSVRYVVISLHTDPNANGEGAAVPSTTPGGAMHDAVHYSGGAAASASAYMAMASAGYGGNAKDSLLPPFAYELGGTGRGRRASVLPQLLRSPAVFSELMLVADQKGRLLHVTAAMAAALGRSVESVRNAGLAALMPEPYGLIHRPWMHLLAIPPGKSWGDNAAATAVGHGAPQPPPHSCRSGVTLSLCGYDESEGPVDVPFRMRLQQRLSTTPKGPGRVHVMAFERRTRNQAMAERRMRLTVDLSGTITAADPAPASLFGVDPRQMVGRSLADLVDVFQLAAQVQGQQQQQEQERREQTQGQQVLEQVRSPSADPTGSSSLEQQQDVQETLTASIATATGAVASPFSSDRIKGDLKRAGSGAVDLMRMASGTAGSEAAGNAVRTPSGSVVAHDAATGPSGFASAQLHPSSVAADSPLAVAGDDPDKLLTLLMLELSKRGSSAEGMSWRVGVSLPADDSADAELQRLRAALGDKHVAAAAAALGAKVVPAVMVVRMVRRPHATAPAASSTAYPTRLPGGGSAYPSGGGLRSGASLGGAGLYGGSVGFGAGAQPLRPNPQTEQYVPLQQYQQDPAAFHSRPVKQGSTDTLQSTEQQYPSSTQQHQKHQQPSAYVDRNSGSGDSPLGTRNGDADGRSGDRRQPAGEATEWHVCADRGADGFGGDWATGAACLASVPSGMIAERGPAKRQRYRNLPPPPAAPMPPAPPPVPPLSSLTSVGMTAETAVLSATPAPSRSQLPEIDGVVTAASTREESFPQPMPPAARGGGRGADGMPIGSMVGSPLASPRNPLVAAAAAEAAMISSSRSPSFSVPTQQPWTSPQREHGSPRSGSVQTPFASRTASHDHARSGVPQQDQQNCPPSRSVRRSATMPSSKDLAAAQKGHREQSAEEQGQQYYVPAQHGRYRHADPTRIPSNAQAAFQRPFQPTQHEPVWSPQQQRQYHQQPWQPAPQTQQAPALDAAALAPSLRLEVELWRADLLGGVLELDARGRVARVDPHDSLGRAGLILGSPSGGLLNANIATLLPLPPAGAAALLTMPQPAADTIGSRSAPVLRGALKHRSGDAGRSGVVGPPLVLTARHAGDCCEVQLRLQAVRRTGVDGGMYIVLRPHRPTPVQPGFVRWLAAGDAAGLAANPPAGTIGSGSSTLAAGSNAGTLHTSATGLGVLAAMQPAGAPGTPRGVGGTGCAAASPSMKAMAATMAFHDVGRSDLPLVSAGPGSPHGRRASGVVAAAKLAPLPAAAAPAAPSISSPATPTVPEAVVSQAEQAAAIAAARPFTAAVVMPAAEPMVLSPRARPASSKPRPNLTSVAQAAAVRAPAAADGGDVTASSMGSAHEPPPMAWPAGIAVTPAVAASAAAAAASLLDGMATATADATSQAITAARRGSLRVADQHVTSTDQHVSSTGRTPAELRRRPSFNEPGGGDGAPEAALSGTAQRRHDNLLARSRRGSHLSRLESWVLSSSGIDPDAEPPNRAASSAHSRLLPGAVPAGPTAAGTVSESDAKDDSSHDEVHDGMGQYGSDHDLDTSSADSDEDYDGEAGRQRQRGRKHRSGADPLAEDEAILRTLEGTAGKLDVGDGKATVTSGPALDGAFAAASGSRSGGLPSAGVTELREGILPEGALDSNQGRGGGGGSGSEVGSDASGVGTAFGAGKRFKRLYRLLMGPPSQAHSSRLWWRLLAVVGAILVIHTITFAVMVSRLNLQLNDIRELNDVGAAAARMHDIAINARTLATLYTTHTDAVRAGNAGINASSYNFTPAAGMQVFGEDLAIASRRVLAQMEEMTLELKELQQDIFLGKRKSLRMPTGFGFRDIWELPRLPVVDFYNRNDNITGQLFSAAGYSSNGSLILEPELIRETVPMGLWRASNLFVAAALELAETAEAYVAAGVDFSALASYNFVVYNGMDVLWPAYQDSIDAVVQITIGNGREVYTLMLMILVVEGIVIGLGASAFVWYEAQQFTNYHYNLYTVFVLVPMGLVRGLANMSIELEPGNEDEDALLNNANTLAAAEEDGDGAGGKGMDAGSALAIADPLVLPSPALLDTEVFYGGGKGMFLPPAVTVAASAKPRILRIQSAGRPMASAGFEHPGTLPRYNSGDGDGSGPDAAMADEVAAIAAAAVTGKDLPTGSSKADRGCGATGGGHISTRKVQSSPSMLARAAAAASFSAAHNASRLLSFRFLASNKVAPHFGANSGSGSARAGKPPRRKLVASRRLATLLVLPFLAWSLVLVSIDLSVFATLNGNDGPIASLGILHSTISRLDRTLYYALDLAASSGNATGAAVAHAALSREILEAQVEYDVLLHGREALGWAPSNITHRPHLEQETRGIVWSGHTVTNILYGEGQCLCFNPVKCQPPTSPYFQLTYNGLHLMTTSIFKATRSMLAQPLGGSSGLNSTEFRFIWALAQSDVEGGMYRLIDIYLKEVQKAYEIAETKQIILFVLAVVWAVAFVWLQLRPFLRRARLEMRRIAELLSQLPPELEVEALMTRLVMSCSAGTSTRQDAGGKKRIGKPADDAGRAESSVVGGSEPAGAGGGAAGPGMIGGARRTSVLSLMNGSTAWNGNGHE